MLDHLRQHAISLLASAEVITLSTCGPSGIQAEILPCKSCGTRLYIFVPLTSEHLINLDVAEAVVVTTSGWQLFGTARCIGSDESSPVTPRLCAAGLDAQTVIEVRPVRLNVGQADGCGFRETIDIFDETPWATACYPQQPTRAMPRKEG